MNNSSTVHHTSPRPRPGAPADDARVDEADDPRIEALLGLYRTHFTNLVRLALLLVEDRDTAVDVVNDAFVRHARPSRSNPPELPSIGVLRRAVITSARNRPANEARTAHEAKGASAEKGASATTTRNGAVGPASLLAALYALPHAQRESLVLQHYGALSDDDVANAAGLPLDHVAESAAEGLRALHSMLSTGERT